MRRRLAHGALALAGVRVAGRRFDARGPELLAAVSSSRGG